MIKNLIKFGILLLLVTLSYGVKAAGFEESYRTGFRLEKEGNYKAAIGRYQKALSFQPDSHAILLRLGNINYRIKKNDAALNWYRKYLELKPGNSKVVEFVQVLEKRIHKKKGSDRGRFSLGGSFGYGMVDGTYPDPFGAGVAPGGELFDFSQFGAGASLFVDYRLASKMALGLGMHYWPDLKSREAIGRGSSSTYKQETRDTENWSGWAFGIQPAWWFVDGQKWRIGLSLDLGILFAAGDLEYRNLEILNGVTIIDIEGGAEVSGQGFYIRPGLKVERSIGSRFAWFTGINYVQSTIDSYQVKVGTGDFYGLSQSGEFLTARGPLITTFKAFRLSVGLRWAPGPS